MAEHKFIYTVSSRHHLSEGHKAKIAQAITVAVAQALAEEPVTQERAEFLNIGRIHGGLWIDTAKLEPTQIESILSAQAAAVGAQQER